MATASHPPLTPCRTPVGLGSTRTSHQAHASWAGALDPPADARGITRGVKDVGSLEGGPHSAMVGTLPLQQEVADQRRCASPELSSS